MPLLKPMLRGGKASENTRGAIFYTTVVGNTNNISLLESTGTVTTLHTFDNKRTCTKKKRRDYVNIPVILQVL